MPLWIGIPQVQIVLLSSNWWMKLGMLPISKSQWLDNFKYYGIIIIIIIIIYWPVGQILSNFCSSDYRQQKHSFLGFIIFSEGFIEASIQLFMEILWYQNTITSSSLLLLFWTIIKVCSRGRELSWVEGCELVTSLLYVNYYGATITRSLYSPCTDYYWITCGRFWWSRLDRSSTETIVHS